MAIVAYTTVEIKFLKRFITEEVTKRRAESSRLPGVASGSILNLLRIYNPELRTKVHDRAGMIAVARKLGFTIDACAGGGRSGPCVWEYIDLPPQKAVRTQRA